jgi:hypothetical protein
MALVSAHNGFTLLRESQIRDGWSRPRLQCWQLHLKPSANQTYREDMIRACLKVAIYIKSAIYEGHRHRVGARNGPIINIGLQVQQDGRVAKQPKSPPCA